MTRGSLSNHLYGEGYTPLSWKQRLRICISVAQGLNYLHTGAKYALYHGNIKSPNILLSDESVCKLSDFGLSKLGSYSMSKVSKVRKESRVIGTFGYMAPEYAMHGELTEKSDVFSFGVVLFEVLFGRPVTDSTMPENQSFLLDWAKESLREGTIYLAIDSYLKGRIVKESLKKYLEIASSCVHFKANARPAMGEVEVTLELALDLQDRADSEMEAINTSAERMYEDESISTAVSNFDFGFPSYCTSSGNSSLDSDSNNSNNNDEMVKEEVMLCRCIHWQIKRG